MTTTAIKLVFDSTLSIPSPSLAETPEKISDTILRFVVSHSFCLIGQASLESILAINISTGDCIRLSITFDASTSTVLLAAKGFVARLLRVDLSHLTELDLSNKVLSLPMQAKRMAIPGLRASLDVLAFPSLVPATMHSVFIKQVPPPSLLERNNAKNGSTILTDTQHKEKLHLLSIVSQTSNQILDYARVCVSRSKLKQAMQSARVSRRMHEDDKGNCDSYFDDDGYGYNADSDEDDETEDGPTTIIPLTCLVRDVIVLRSSTRQRGKLISEKIIQEITKHCKSFGWNAFHEIQQVKETTSLEILDEAVTIPSLLPTQLLQQPLRSSTQSLLQVPKLKLPLPGNGWPSGETSSSGFMSALTVAKFQRVEKNNFAVSSATSETSLKNLEDECKPKKSWLSMRSRELESKSSSSPSSSSSSSIIERFLFNLHSLSWLSHRNESAASSKQLEAICSALLGSESAADTFDDELLSSSLSSSSSTAALAAREPKQLSIRFQTADDAAREKDDREGKEMTYGGPGIMDADLTSNTTAAERNKLLASMNLSVGVDTAEVGGGGGGAVTSDAIAGKKKPTAKRKASSAKSSTKSSKIAKIITDGATEQGGEAASSEPMTAVVPAVAKDLVALASAVTQIVTEANGDKVALEKELTSKRVTLDQLKAYAKTEAKVAISGAKAVLVARILAKIMP
jgi:hypothetical protein